MRAGLSVVCVGTGTGVPRLERGGPCTLVRAADTKVVVDLGLGALHGLLRAGVAHRDVDALLLTHLHPDHTAELAAFFFAANYDEEPRSRSLLVAGGSGTAEFVAALRRAHGCWLDPRGYVLDLRELGPGEGLAVGPLACSAGAVRHIPSSLAYRVDAAGATLVLSGDTGPSPELERFASDVDLLLLEASLPPERTMAEHLTAAEAGALARRARAKRLLLYHLYPSADRTAAGEEASATFGAPVEVARDGTTLSLL